MKTENFSQNAYSKNLIIEIPKYKFNHHPLGDNLEDEDKERYAGREKIKEQFLQYLVSVSHKGAYIKIGTNEYLLFYNNRYDATSKPADKKYHFPLKLNLSCSIPNYFDDPTVAKQLIDQVFQFSRTYWKSTNQQSLPGTIKYPKMVAQIYLYFTYDILADFGQENLCFCKRKTEIILNNI